MSSLVLSLLAGGERKAFCDAQFDLHAGYIKSRLNGKTWFLGDGFSAADIMMSFALQFILYLNKGNYPNIERMVAQIESHPSYPKACERVGEVHLGQ